ncbi:MAG: DUF885 family protein, partial [Bacteroidota bacterium]
LWETQFRREVLLDELASQSNYEGWQWLGHYQPMPIAPISHYEARDGVDLDIVFRNRVAELADIQLEIEELEGVEEPVSELARELLTYQLRLQENGRPFVQYRFALDPFDGIQLRFPLYLLAQHPIHNKEEAEAYMGRIDIFAEELLGLQEWMKRQEENDLLPPAFLIERSLAQVEALLATPAKEHPLYVHLGRKLVRVNPTEMNEWEATDYLIRLEDIIEQRLYPAWQELATVLETWQERTTQSGAAYDLPRGQEYYQQCLQAYLGPDADAAIIQQAADQEVQRLRLQLDRVLDSLEVPAGGLAKRLKAFETHYVSNSHQNPDSALMLSRQSLAEFSRLLAGAFPLDRLPGERMRFQALPARWEQASFPSELIPPEAGRKVLPSYWLNSTAWPTWYQPTLTALDLVPGTYQSRSRRYMPDFRTGMHFPAWEAGWSWYALSTLERDIPLLPSRAEMYVSYLHLKLTKAAIAQADVSVHTKKWDRSTAIAYLRDQAGIPDSLASTETDRLFAAPGAGTIAVVGWLFFDQLYRDTYLTYPDRLSLLEWHRWLLDIGPMPFQMTEDQVTIRLETNLAS